LIVMLVNRLSMYSGDPSNPEKSEPSNSAPKIAKGKVYHAITSEPFGSNSFTPIEADNPRISEIQQSEEAFIRKLKSLEKL